MSDWCAAVEYETFPSPHSSTNQQPLHNVVSSPECARHSPCRGQSSGMNADTGSIAGAEWQMLSGHSVLNKRGGAVRCPAQATAVDLSGMAAEKVADGGGTLPTRVSYLDGLHEREKQFDSRVAALDEMLMRAREGCLQRDELIDRLSAEVDRLQAELCCVGSTDSRARRQRGGAQGGEVLTTKEACAKTEEMSGRMRDECRYVGALDENPGLCGTDGQVGTGRREPKPQGCVVGNRRRHHRARFVTSLHMLQKQVCLLEQRYRMIVEEKEALAEENQFLRRMVGSMEEDLEGRLARAARVARRRSAREGEVEEQIMVTRLSMARLFHVLSEVPGMRRYLRVEGVEKDFVFLGYTAVQLEGTADGCGDGWQRCGPVPAPTVGTGVDNGVYAGGGKARSQNIYLNGKWSDRLRDILEDENRFLCSAGVHAGGLESSAHTHGGGGVPRVAHPCDVLQGRHHDKDFWVPCAVFVEAQRFKNRYFPSMSMECFYPFLIAVNTIWNEQMTRRVATATTRVSKQWESRRRLLACVRRRKCNCVGAPLHPRGKRVLSPPLEEFQRRLQLLRCEVRRRVTGRNSLDIFCRYDQLVGQTIRHLRDIEGRCITSPVPALGSGRASPEYCASSTFRVCGGTLEEVEKGRRSSGNEASCCRRRAARDLEGVLDISHRASSSILTSCQDMLRLLDALRRQRRWLHPCESRNHGAGGGCLVGGPGGVCAHASGFHRLVDGVAGFVEEVRREVLETHRALEEYCVYQEGEEEGAAVLSRYCHRDADATNGVQDEACREDVGE